MSAENKNEVGEVVPTGGGGLSLVRNLEDAVQMARMIAESNIVPTCYRKPAAAFAALELAREVGIPPMQFMQKSFYVEKSGRIGVEVELLLALVYKSNKADIKFGFDEDVDVDKNKGIAFCEVSRRDTRLSFRMTYSIAEAKRAGLMSKDNWKYPPDMLLRRAIGKALKLTLTDVLLGVSTTEEIMDMEEGDFSLEDAADMILAKPKMSVIPIDELLALLKSVDKIPDDRLYAVIYSAAHHLAAGNTSAMRNKYYDLCAGKGDDGEDVPPMRDASKAGYVIQREYVRRLKPRFELWAETMKRSETPKLSSEPVGLPGTSAPAKEGDHK